MSSGNHGKPVKSQTISMHGKLVEFGTKTELSWKNYKIVLNNLTKLSVARKLAVRHTKRVCLSASFLATCGYKF